MEQLYCTASYTYTITVLHTDMCIRIHTWGCTQPWDTHCIYHIIHNTHGACTQPKYMHIPHNITPFHLQTHIQTCTYNNVYVVCIEHTTHACILIGVATILITLHIMHTIHSTRVVHIVLDIHTLNYTTLYMYTTHTPTHTTVSPYTYAHTTL